MFRVAPGCFPGVLCHSVLSKSGEDVDASAFAATFWLVFSLGLCIANGQESSPAATISRWA
jgi:hypothetical protein